MLDVYLDPSAIAVDPLPDLPEALPEPETVRAARALRRELEEARHLKPAQARPPAPSLPPQAGLRGRDSGPRGRMAEQGRVREGWGQGGHAAPPRGQARREGGGTGLVPSLDCPAQGGAAPARAQNERACTRARGGGGGEAGRHAEAAG